MPYYTIFRTNGLVEEINALNGRRFSKGVLDTIENHMGWVGCEFSERPLYYNKYNGGKVIMIWNMCPTGALNHNITAQLERGDALYKNWGDGIKGDVIIKSNKRLVVE